MRLTALTEGRVRGAGYTIPAPAKAQGTSIPSPIGGWDAASPISDMPEQNAVELINWFPQPGWIELRRGYIEHSDTGTGDPVDTVMEYQGITTTDDRLFAASGTQVFNVTSDPGVSVLSGLTNPRWQYVNFGTSGGHFLWMCNGSDTPRFYNGTVWATAVITGVTASDMIHCCAYRGRIWTVLKNSTKAAYLPLDSVQGAATTLELGSYFTKGGYLNAIGAWSTDAQGGTNEFIVFLSSYGEAAIFLIYDPTTGDQFSYRGTSNLGSPIGRRCMERVGADVLVTTINGVLPLSQVISYDESALLGLAITKNIRQAMTDAAQAYGTQFGWQTLSYPRSNMIILNVPLVEGAQQEQFVMNSLTGAWCRFTGQAANSWCVFQNRAYFGGNDGIVRLADEGSGDENATLEADMQGAFNYYGVRGRNKRWTMLRPLITKDSSYLVTVQIGLSLDFELNDMVDVTITPDASGVAIWNDPGTLWDVATWPGVITISDWQSISGIGYCASIRVRVSIPWDATLVAPQNLRINSFDMLYEKGDFI